MKHAEYFLIFDGSGPVRVIVKCNGKRLPVAERSMHPTEIAKLIKNDRKGFMQHMDFDEHPFEVLRYVIDPHKNLLTIEVKKGESLST